MKAVGVSIIIGELENIFVSHTKKKKKKCKSNVIINKISKNTEHSAGVLWRLDVTSAPIGRITDDW